jgi:uncharacterized protein (DUF58 family)
MTHVTHRWPRWYPLTGEGTLWFIIAGALLTTGLLKGINLMTLLAWMLLVLLAWNWWLARRQVRAARVERVAAPPIFAGVPVELGLRLAAEPRRRLGSLNVEDAEGRRWLVLDVPANASALAWHTTTFPRRGHIALPALLAISGHPFGLVRQTRDLGLATTQLVFPHLFAVSKGRLRVLLHRHSRDETHRARRARRHAQAQLMFHGLRAYQPGDSPRLLHWKTTARLGQLMVREFEDPPGDHLTLIVEARRDPANPSALEDTLSAAASIAWEWNRQAGDPFTLILLGATPTRLDGNTGHEFSLRIQELLAVEPGVEEVPRDAVPGLLRQHKLRGSAVLVVSPGGSHTAHDVQRTLNAAPLVLDGTARDDGSIFSR